MTARSIDSIIHDLGRDLAPVRRMAPPWVRALGWLALVACGGVALACFADLPALATRLRSAPDMWLGFLGSALTAVLAALAAFELSLPDRRAIWALLPVPAALLWLGASGLGCLRGWPIPGLAPAGMGVEPSCFAFIVGVSVPLSLALVLMVRRGCPLRPGLAAMMTGTAAAAAAATLLVLVHPHDASVSDLLVHAVAVGLVIGANRLLGGRLLAAGTGA